MENNLEKSPEILRTLRNFKKEINKNHMLLKKCYGINSIKVVKIKKNIHSLDIYLDVKKHKNKQIFSLHKSLNILFSNSLIPKTSKDYFLYTLTQSGYLYVNQFLKKAFRLKIKININKKIVKGIELLI